ncbi:MAG: hypothetical protein COX07_02720 [Bacteroidetes bacterium CG23_combo_of_CG06-09_8_20_14_all_32_9]|nr:MAG: hypothetical protein COX07_02720 [Bacteroidetes bacterium CG23_combo_of_CG06-09_8_20_14_all_32_9]
MEWFGSAHHRFGAFIFFGYSKKINFVTVKILKMKPKIIFFTCIFYFTCHFSFSQTASLMNVNSWAFQLQNININQIANDSTFELIVIG